MLELGGSANSSLRNSHREHVLIVQPDTNLMVHRIWRTSVAARCHNEARSLSLHLNRHYRRRAGYFRADSRRGTQYTYTHATGWLRLMRNPVRFEKLCASRHNRWCAKRSRDEMLHMLG
jgi:hypothetical protein